MGGGVFSFLARDQAPIEGTILFKKDAENHPNTGKNQEKRSKS